eukprot:TRINITY_DN1954_c0_g1_i1.p1 TRINITY_DN1954_c0_g1~~TRINITY_DN1954_c0_g1_i1.p1  ORF type:complete len:152 (+),score=3.13 TRINITY_DN1954_c0_g1_i1:76-531(+)
MSNTGMGQELLSKIAKAYRSRIRVYSSIKNFATIAVRYVFSALVSVCGLANDAMAAAKTDYNLKDETEINDKLRKIWTRANTIQHHIRRLKDQKVNIEQALSSLKTRVQFVMKLQPAIRPREVEDLLPLPLHTLCDRNPLHLSHYKKKHVT